MECHETRKGCPLVNGAVRDGRNSAHNKKEYFANIMNKKQVSNLGYMKRHFVNNCSYKKEPLFKL